MAATSVEDLQEAFFNFDEDASGYISIETLRLMVTLDGEPMHDAEDFLAEAQQFSDGRGNVDYKAFSECMLGNND
eukprot:CAMPEP_0114622108 /NCGR_PEP_ID=MMETSP0168-20121206/9571_1 /TAXON_ID=95228 ORGANISM="Vannella sp., Strain DIVA3 517/6/12" /NCGR_SAMPLE_ID=MMETSP0168 /ASSEMBLY_ACC=CAM_ASM_000044 /LENGTH=74 /DNA_ID=CAMNT_0001833321 /DNA_START=34 /DNA_END=258 /DNA_ORIENTATION=-